MTASASSRFTVPGSLTPRHAEELKKRGISADFAIRSGVRTAADNELRDLGFGAALPLEERKKGLQGICFEYRDLAAHYVALKQLLEEYDHNQIHRIRNSLSKTRLSILFYGINNACLKISEQTLLLLNIFEETLQLEGRRN